MYACRACYAPVAAPKPGRGVLCPCRFANKKDGKERFAKDVPLAPIETEEEDAA